jgi:hypothetical protein
MAHMLTMTLCLLLQMKDYLPNSSLQLLLFHQETFMSKSRTKFVTLSAVL